MAARSGRDPRRSLLLGVAIAACVLAALAAVVAYGIYTTFSARQDRSPARRIGGRPIPTSGCGGSAALDCRHA